MEQIITFFLTFDILLKFITAVKKEDEPIPVDDMDSKLNKDKENRVRMSIRFNDVKSKRSNGLDDPKWERDIAVICR